MNTKTKENLLGPRVESPTWGDLQRMAEVVIDKLGGPAGAANDLSYQSFYVLTLLASLNLDEKKSAAFIFGKQWLT